MFSRFANNLPLIRNARKSIAYVYALAFSLISLFAITVLFLMVIGSHVRLMNNQVEDYGNTLVSQYGKSVTEPLFTNDEFTIEILSNRFIEEKKIKGVGVYSLQKKIPIIALGQLPPNLEEVIKEDAVQIYQWLGNSSNMSFLSPIEFKGVVAGYAIITLPVNNIQENFDRALVLLVVVTLLTILATFFLAYIMSKKLANPIKRLVVTTNRLGTGDYSVKLKNSRIDEIGRLTDAINMMAKNLRKKQRVESLLNKMVDQKVAEKFISHIENTDAISNADEDHYHFDNAFDNKEIDVTVVFIDIVGFTSYSEKATPNQVVNLLNDYFSYFTLCSQFFSGSVDKFIGDCAMVVFGAPTEDNDHQLNGVLCGLAIIELLKKVNVLRRVKGLSTVDVAIGINSGTVRAGVIGAINRMEYTVVGDPVNLASRLCDAANANEIIVGDNMLEHNELLTKIKTEGSIRVDVKGKSETVNAYKVTTLKDKKILKSVMDFVDKTMKELQFRVAD